MSLIVTDRVQVESFHFGSGPIGLSQEFQTTLDARIVGEAANPDSLSEFLPAILHNQIVQYRLERDPMKGIVGLRVRTIGFCRIHGTSLA